MQRSVLLTAIRVGIVYEATNYLSQAHLESRALPILARQKNNPLKNDLLDKIN